MESEFSTRKSVRSTPRAAAPRKLVVAAGGTRGCVVGRDVMRHLLKHEMAENRLKEVDFAEKI
jgi:hypothetical protein